MSEKQHAVKFLSHVYELKSLKFIKVNSGILTFKSDTFLCVQNMLG